MPRSTDNLHVRDSTGARGRNGSVATHGWPDTACHPRQRVSLLTRQPEGAKRPCASSRASVSDHAPHPEEGPACHPEGASATMRVILRERQRPRDRFRPKAVQQRFSSRGEKRSLASLRMTDGASPKMTAGSLVILMRAQRAEDLLFYIKTTPAQYARALLFEVLVLTLTEPPPASGSAHRCR
jgi:hypothetical protein